VFNSDYSNVLEFIEISAVQNLAISNSILTFDSVADAVGYEIYSFASGSYEKINKDLLFANQYEFTTFEGQKTIVVKAISKTNGYSNSNYSDEIVVDKLTKPEISVENGKFKIALSQTIIQLLLNDNVKIIPEITNVQNEKVKIDLEIEGEPADILMGGLSGTLNNGDIHYQISYSLATRQFVGTLVCEPYMFLSYNSSSAVEEKLNVQIRVEYTEPISGVYYLNSNTETISGCGLFEPTKINKTTNNDDAMEFITWSPSTKNTLNGNELSVGYVFKIVYGVGDEVKTYYSNDNQLKYYDLASKTYVSYPAIISGVSAVFPAGYDENGDGHSQAQRRCRGRGAGCVLQHFQARGCVLGDGCTGYCRAGQYIHAQRGDQCLQLEKALRRAVHLP